MPSRNKLISVFAIGLAILSFGYVYWFHFLPLQDRIASLNLSIDNEEDLISQLEEKQQNGNGEIVKQTASLQKKLPVAPLLDQFILDLEKAEVASGSLITSFTFNEKLPVNQDSESLLGTEQQNENDSAANENNGNAQTGNGNIQSETEGTVTEPTLPEGIERLTVSMTVEAPSYFELETFIRVIEELPRISKIDSLSFTGNKEARDTGVSANSLVYSVTVSTFYFPKLEELKNQLPKYEQPPPAKKINPLYPSGSYDKEKDDAVKDKNIQDQLVEERSLNKDKIPSKLIQKNGESYLVYTYHVQPGDNLFRIAIEFYNSRDGEQIIKDWNGIDKLLAGTTIEIPILNEGK